MEHVDPEADDGVFRKTRFAPLAVTGFSNKSDWPRQDLRRGGSMVIESREFRSTKIRDKSANEDIMRLTNENFKLTQKLNKLQEKLQSNNLNLDDVRSVAPTSVFKRISQRTLDREKKVNLMYA